ncbi:MAG: hypothetical protein P3B76_02470 [Gemmatimonadota bacterium]|jgi:hypothetical protein|nr:hypothetical protein [Gemmatimonadota bacterium]MDQ8166215.1 hypothetical protein [Gemmatimonadota bacterium]MDQ8171526.1 hypothetical protein [Gemmatimonadota bacterium]
MTAPTDRSTPMSYHEADLSRVTTIPVQSRPNKVRADEFAAPPPDDPAARSMGAFLASLPDILVARDFLAVVDAIVAARRKGRGVLLMLGGHVVKTGLARVLVDLVRRGIITHVAMNGSAAIHDYEIARFGGTSEDVAAGLRDGSFGMADETGRGLNGAFVAGMAQQWGMGESVARALADAEPLLHPELSLTYQCWRHHVPATIHAALGCEIIHQHPAANGAAIGDTSHRDFRRLAASLSTLHDGGVVLNVGSAVIMPEVFLKALTIARNLNGGAPTGFVTCDLDMQRHYRPRMNVVRRPTQDSGKGYEITGHHEIMVPMLAWAIVERMGQDG